MHVENQRYISQTPTVLLVTYNSVTTLVLSLAYLMGIIHDSQQFNTVIFQAFSKRLVFALHYNYQK